jgi:two-component system, chemotaxis family, chemotaxis protein CheY
VADRPKKRVLIVDDANLVRLYYRGVLETAGYIVDEALNGLEALERLYAEPADLLVVDVNMPQMDGFTFVRTLRSRELPLSSLPVLVISTEGALNDFAAASAAGANFYLVKPATAEALVEYAALLCGGPD